MKVFITNYFLLMSFLKYKDIHLFETNSCNDHNFFWCKFYLFLFIPFIPWLLYTINHQSGELFFFELYNCNIGHKDGASLKSRKMNKNKSKKCPLTVFSRCYMFSYLYWFWMSYLNAIAIRPVNSLKHS